MDDILQIQPTGKNFRLFYDGRQGHNARFLTTEERPTKIPFIIIFVIQIQYQIKGLFCHIGNDLR